MVALTVLWLPILLSAVLVFVVSWVFHMALPHHRKDYAKLPDEEKVRAALRGIPPGNYLFPCPADPKDMASPEMTKKYEEGPVGMMAVMPNGPPMMPKHLAEWFAYCLAIGVFVAYLTGRALEPGAAYLSVFRFAGTVAFLGHAASHAVDPIWKGGAWSTAFKHALDGLAYGLVTAGVFGWLWP
jgi:hypothetical protein